MSDDERGILDAQVVSNRGLAEASLSVRILFAPSAEPKRALSQTTKRIETMQSIQASAARRPVARCAHSRCQPSSVRSNEAAWLSSPGRWCLNAPAAAQTNLAREFRWLSAARARGFVISSGSSQNSTAVSSAHSITDISRSTMRPSIQFSPPAVASVALPIDPQDLRSAQLSNGMRIVALKTGHFPLVAFSLLVPGWRQRVHAPRSYTWAQVLGKQLELFPGKWSTYPLQHGLGERRCRREHTAGSGGEDRSDFLAGQSAARAALACLFVAADLCGANLRGKLEVVFRLTSKQRASTAFSRGLWRGHAYGSRHQT
jgi:hypothetical protein